MWMINNRLDATAYDSPVSEVAALQQSASIASRSCFETAGDCPSFAEATGAKWNFPLSVIENPMDPAARMN